MIVVTIIGILSAIAIPNFVKYQSRARTSEAKTNLRAWYTAQRSIFQEKGTYTTELGLAGFDVERGNRYQYAFAASGSLQCQARTAATVTTDPTDNCITVDTFRHLTSLAVFTAPAGLTYAGGDPAPGNPAGMGGTCPSCNIAGYAIANLDSDGAYDTWHITTKGGSVTAAPASCIEAEPVVSGVPINTVVDGTCP